MTQMNLSMKQKHIQRHRRQTCIFQAWVGGGGVWDGGRMDWDFGIIGCTLKYRMNKQQCP